MNSRTKNICQNAIDNNIEKIIVLSSNSPFGLNINKDTPLMKIKYNPYFNYGRSKMLMEEYIKEIQSKKLLAQFLLEQWFGGPYQPDRQNLFLK